MSLSCLKEEFHQLLTLSTNGGLEIFFLALRKNSFNFLTRCDFYTKLYVLVLAQSNLYYEYEKTFYQDFWCQMNDADSEVMVRLLGREGYRKVDSRERADTIIVNKNN